MKQRKTTNQKGLRAKQHPLPVRELTDEQLAQVTGGLNPQPLPPGGAGDPSLIPPDPVLPPDLGTTQIIVIGG